MPTYKAVIAYDGSAFCGFALQKHRPSVLGHLHKALQRVGIDSQIIGASRTDKGVHATWQVISFCSNKLWELDSLRNLLNLKLYPHIFIKRLTLAPDGFHPRFSARYRAYRFVLVDKIPPPFFSRYVSYVNLGDMEIFTRALKAFRGVHDFAMFKKNGSFTHSNVREIFSIYPYRYNGLTIVYVRGNGFLRSQVRLMVGASLCVSRGEMSFDELDRQIMGIKKTYHYPISPSGLYLCSIGY